MAAVLQMVEKAPLIFTVDRGCQL